MAHPTGYDSPNWLRLTLEYPLTHPCSASTCFNILRLPSYGHHDILRQKLLMAIRDAPEGFAFS